MAASFSVGMASRAQTPPEKKRRRVLAPTNSDAGSQVATETALRVTGGESFDVPPEYYAKYNLPATYQVRTCLLCHLHSLTKSPFQDHPDCKAWHPFLPWAQGTLAHPAGNICRLCNYVFQHGGYSVEFRTIKLYIAALNRKDNSLNLHQEFLQSRQKYIDLKLENPSLVLRSSKAIYLPRLLEVTDIQADALEAPKEYFMELSVYEQKFGKPSPDQVVTETFRGKRIRGVKVCREEDRGMFLLRKTQTRALRSTQALNDGLQLRDGQQDGQGRGCNNEPCNSSSILGIIAALQVRYYK